jgi:hypothetical protein
MLTDYIQDKHLQTMMIAGANLNYLRLDQENSYQLTAKTRRLNPSE